MVVETRFAWSDRDVGRGFVEACCCSAYSFVSIKCKNYDFVCLCDNCPDGRIQLSQTTKVQPIVEVVVLWLVSRISRHQVAVVGSGKVERRLGGCFRVCERRLWNAGDKASKRGGRGRRG